jgi:hypothetical protein
VHLRIYIRRFKRLGCCGNLILVVAVAAALFVVLVRHKAQNRGGRGGKAVVFKRVFEVEWPRAVG